MRQNLFVVCFGGRSCCLKAARCFLSRKSKDMPLFWAEAAGAASIAMHTEESQVFIVWTKAVPENNPWNTEFKVTAGWEGGQIHKQWETSWKKGVGDLDSFPFISVKKNFVDYKLHQEVHKFWANKSMNFPKVQLPLRARYRVFLQPPHAPSQSLTLPGETTLLIPKTVLLFLNIMCIKACSTFSSASASFIQPYVGVLYMLFILVAVSCSIVWIYLDLFIFLIEVWLI